MAERPLEDHIETLSSKAAKAENSGEAVQYAQAALNVANALAVLNHQRQARGE